MLVILVSRLIIPAKRKHGTVRTGAGGLTWFSYHNYQTYLSQWSRLIGEGNVTARPEAVGLMYDNTTVHGSWIQNYNMTELSQKFNGRIINNISLAMPHAGVFGAAREPINNIMQPQDLMAGALK